MASRINEFAHNNWNSFATQDYFDYNGFFCAVMFTGPLLFYSIFIVVRD